MYSFQSLQRPTFISIDDHAISLEWCFGEQGSDDSQRVSFFCSKNQEKDFDEQQYTIYTFKDGQIVKTGKDAVDYLGEILQKVG